MAVDIGTEECAEEKHGENEW